MRLVSMKEFKELPNGILYCEVLPRKNVNDDVRFSTLRFLIEVLQPHKEYFFFCDLGEPSNAEGQSDPADKTGYKGSPHYHLQALRQARLQRLDVPRFVENYACCRIADDPTLQFVVWDKSDAEGLLAKLTAVVGAYPDLPPL